MTPARLKALEAFEAQELAIANAATLVALRAACLACLLTGTPLAELSALLNDPSVPKAILEVTVAPIEAPKSASGVRRSTATVGAASAEAQPKVLAFLVGKTPQTIGTIAKALGFQPDELKHPMAKLCQDKKLTKEGEKRATRYSLAA